VKSLNLKEIINNKNLKVILVILFILIFGLFTFVSLRGNYLEYKELGENYLEIFLIDVMRSMTETESGNKTFLKDRAFDKKPVANVVKVLSENVFLPLSIDQICKKTNYSRSYLFREFKAETGKSIIQYFIDLKIEKAKELLRENDLSIKEISEKLAFDTPNYFSKTFKKVTGYTPSTYRKMRRQVK